MNYKTFNLKKMACVALLSSLLATSAFAADDVNTALVFGHKNPDTDTISGAYAVANLLNGRGIKAEAVA